MAPTVLWPIYPGRSVPVSYCLPIFAIQGNTALHVLKVIRLIVEPVEELCRGAVHPLVALVQAQAGQPDVGHNRVGVGQLSHDEIVFFDVVHRGQVSTLKL
jgi:hypothetical protein